MSVFFFVYGGKYLRDYNEYSREYMEYGKYRQENYGHLSIGIVKPSFDKVINQIIESSSYIILQFKTFIVCLSTIIPTIINVEWDGLFIYNPF